MLLFFLLNHIIMKQIEICRVRLPDVRGDIVKEIFPHLTLASSTYVTGCRCSCSLPVVTTLIQNNTISTKHLIQASMLSLRPCGNMNGGIISLSQVNTANTMIWIGYLVLINMNKNLSSDWHSNTLKSYYWDFWMQSGTECCF